MTAAPTMLPPASTLCDLLWLRPDYRGGRLCIAGTGISVGRIGILHSEGRSAEEIWSDLFEPASLAHVHAALAYYLANQEAVDADFQAIDDDNVRLEQEYKAQYKPAR
jgi:uncharacterized protein (DUF433 family)